MSRHFTYTGLWYLNTILKLVIRTIIVNNIILKIQLMLHIPDLFFKLANTTLRGGT